MRHRQSTDITVLSRIFGMKRLPRSLLLPAILAAFQFPAAQAYGPLGHEIVGAIADERLANTATATKIRALLDGLTLERAAAIADEIKGWDKKGVDDLRSFHYSAHRNIDRQLRDFWRANPPSPGANPGAPSHSLVPLHRRSRRAGAKIRRRLRRPQQMGHRPYESILHRGIAGKNA